MIPHGALVSRIRDSLTRFTNLNNDVFIQRQPHGFDFSVWEMFWFMATPFPAVIAPQDSRHDPELLCCLMDKYAVTIMMAPPSFLEALCHFLLATGRTLPTSLRLTVSAGESFPLVLR